MASRDGRERQDREPSVARVRRLTKLLATTLLLTGLAPLAPASASTPDCSPRTISAPAGAEIATRPFQLVTGRKWEGSAFGGARGRTDVPKIVDWYMEGKINIDDLITHTMPLQDINKGFELMKSGESIRGVVVY